MAMPSVELFDLSEYRSPRNANFWKRYTNRLQELQSNPLLILWFTLLDSRSVTHERFLCFYLIHNMVGIEVPNIPKASFLCPNPWFPQRKSPKQTASTH